MKQRDPKYCVVSTRLDDIEHARLTLAAQIRNISLSDLLREAIALWQAREAE